ncbi:MAG: RNA methyltransferase [Moraxellaceae bacterium]|jgi:TrmH family RNA methyltransferase|nr:RNA methyltransferase [Moraxellaceae bacterium]
MEMIRSRQNPLAKQLIKLAENRRDRMKSKQTLLIGSHLVKAAIEGRRAIESLLVCEGHEKNPEIQALLKSNPQTIMLSAELFQAIEQAPSSAGILALIAIPDEPPIVTKGFCLLLENLQDPGNVGTILRTAAAAGVDQVWLTAGCADIWSPKVLRAGMGAHFHLALRERIDPITALDDFTGPLCVTTLSDATSLYHSDLKGSMVLALGSEGAGISAALADRANIRIHIPMAAGIESLNVAAAAAICLFERRRQTLA